ncbi:MAG: ABC transporter ATP-binding protein [Gallionella sp.]|nr:ABC transporter ATP-binding protein [Gallionella sp.]MDD5611828.1 ABC transporter ATP-binding protein [Gallionella sp.]
MSNATPEITLSARNLTRSFGKQQIIHDISLQLRRGEVLGLLGHNGAGKSTTLQMLTGCLIPDSGEIEICGINLRQHPQQAKAYIGYLPETPPLYRELTVRDFLIFAARLRGMKPAGVAQACAQAMQRCGLESVERKPIATLSKGYQQRVGIAQAIIHRPAVIVLDEPTVGLDPAQIRDIRKLIRELGDTSSVILSTHLLGEVESVCDRVEIMRQGKLIYSDTSVRMQHYGQVSGFTITLNNPPPIDELRGLPGVSQVEQLSAQQFRVVHAPDNNPSGVLLDRASQQGWQLVQLTPLHASLEEVFVQITDGEADATQEVQP